MLPERKTLVFLPGLTADHRLFDKQFPFFAGRYNLLTWDAPGHALSRPFTLDFSLMDKFPSAIWRNIRGKRRDLFPLIQLPSSAGMSRGSRFGS